MCHRLSILYIIGLCSVCIVSLNAQFSEGGLPPSFKYDNVLKSGELSVQTPIQVPINFNVEDLILQDSDNQKGQGSPLGIATLISVDFNVNNSGYWTILPEGEKIWRLPIQAKGAIALILYYDEFYIPEGGRLFIYNVDKSHILGAYTSRSNPKSESFSTEFVAGDNIVLEYVVGENGEMPRIQIGEVGYGYNHMEVTKNISLQNIITLQSLSAPCQVNINCEEGAAWQNEKNGIFRIVTRVGDKSYSATGSLINNTAQDFKPYVLSADHCAMNKKRTLRATKKDFTQWQFYGNYERHGCSNNSLNKPLSVRIGCTEIASSPVNGGSDMLLLLLDDIHIHFDLYFNGWDRRDIPPSYGASLHHPKGDRMKIATFEEPATSETLTSDYGTNGMDRSHWNVLFVQTPNGHSITEEGSSGSPLFNQNHLIVGTLSGGNTSCEFPDRLELYGKMSSHWDSFPADTNRLDKWLDPLNTGVKTLNGTYNTEKKSSPINLSLRYINLNIELKWDKPKGEENPISYNLFRNDVFIKNTLLNSYVDSYPEIGNQTYSVSAVYYNGAESLQIYKTIFVSEYLPPVQVDAKQLSNDDIELSWNAPEYKQTVYWGDGVPEYAYVSYDKTPFYFGQMWSKKELLPIYKNKIKAVNFVPTDESKYSILITQGDRKHIQEVTNPTYQVINTIQLDIPFLIDNDNDLYVAIYVSKYADNKYPAACDKGPAVDGKGNLFSFDGKKWTSLYNYNFIVQAVISDEGEIPVSTQTTHINPKEFSGNAYNGKSPSLFFERTGYEIYRNNQKIYTVQANQHKYIDKDVPTGTYNYSVVAKYGERVSPKSYESKSISVDNIAIEDETISIYPILFDEQVYINNAHLIKQIEIISIDGKIVDKISHITDVINTDHLHSGIYIFQIVSEKEVKTIKTIKQ